jgi:hypothetical protein
MDSPIMLLDVVQEVPEATPEELAAAFDYTAFHTLAYPDQTS